MENSGYSRVMGNYLAFFLALLALGVPWNDTSLVPALLATPTPVSLPPYAYLVWVFLCVCLLFSLVWQAVFHDSEEVSKMSTWFMVSSLIQTFWVVSVCYQQYLISSGLIFSLFVSLAILNTRVAGGSPWVRFPMGVWYGWVTYLVLHSFTILFLNHFQLQFFASWVWAVEVITTLSGLSVFWLVFDNLVGFPLVMAWTVLGLYFTHYCDDKVALPAITFYFLLMGALALRLMIEGLKKKSPKEPSLPVYSPPRSNEAKMEAIPPSYPQHQCVYYVPYSYSQLPQEDNSHYGTPYPTFVSNQTPANILE